MKKYHASDEDVDEAEEGRAVDSEEVAARVITVRSSEISVFDSNDEKIQKITNLQSKFRQNRQKKLILCGKNEKFRTRCILWSRRPFRPRRAFRRPNSKSRFWSIFLPNFEFCSTLLIF